MFALTTALLVGVMAGVSGCAPEPVKAPPVTQAPDPGPTLTPTPSPTPPPEPSFDKAAHSLDDPMSIWVVSNKLRPLNPIEFEPNDLVMPEGVGNQNGQPLREPAARAVEAMLAAAAEAGVPAGIISAYRGYELQQSLYTSYIARDGQAAADSYSARPGHSEHQTGLVVDLDDGSGCALSECFGATGAGVWLAEHAAEFGFIVRYPPGKEGVTGFIPEPWHFRYVGPELAIEMRDTGVVTLEEFFGLPPAPDYAQ
ncbi:M15 family metallopeptidase [Leucobacter insecticola]|nr:M15 family metallopeptidase [Leucobacter insecticola]